MANDDQDYADWIRSLPCCLCNQRPPSEIHHSTGAGLALRAKDRDGMPLCHTCHREFHDANGHFKNWPRQARSDWQAAMVRLHNALHDARAARRQPGLTH